MLSVISSLNDKFKLADEGYAASIKRLNQQANWMYANATQGLEVGPLSDDNV